MAETLARRANPGDAFDIARSTNTLAAPSGISYGHVRHDAPVKPQAVTTRRKLWISWLLGLVVLVPLSLIPLGGISDTLGASGFAKGSSVAVG